MLSSELNRNPNPKFDRAVAFQGLIDALKVKLPHLADNTVDMGPLDAFMIDSSLKGRAHSVWLVDGEVTNSVEMHGLHYVPHLTFALQMEIIPLSRGPNTFFGWNLLTMYVVGEFDPQSIVKKIVDFGTDHDAGAVAHYLAAKIKNPHSYDMRRQRASSKEEYLGILDRIKERALIMSTKRQVPEFELFMQGQG